MRQLTIGILNLNQAALTISILERLAFIPKRYWDCETLLVDNGSASEDVETIKHWLSGNQSRFDSILLIESKENLGAAGGRNEIFRRAKFDRVLFLDNDLELPENFDWLDRLWTLLDSSPDIAIVGPLLVFADQPDIVQAAGLGFTKTARVGYLERGLKTGSITRGASEVIASPAACWLVEGDAAKAVGHFSPEYYPAQYEDVDFCIKLKQQGWKVLCDRSVAIKHIENVTTRNLKNTSFARVTVGNAIKLKAKFTDLIPRLANLEDEDIYWGPIPRVDGSKHESRNT